MFSMLFVSISTNDEFLIPADAGSYTNIAYYWQRSFLQYESRCIIRFARWV